MKRGRISSAELATVVIDAGPRLPSSPPPELSAAQSAVWCDVVGSLPADWFTRAAHPILISYCRHVCRAQVLEKQISQFELEWTMADGGLERLDRLLAGPVRRTPGMRTCGGGLSL